MSDSILKSKRQNPSQSHREAGFTLVEVLVAAGVMGILVVGMITMMSNSQKQTQGITAKTDFNSLVNTVQTVLNNTENCLTAFGGANAVQLIGDSGGTKKSISLNIAGTTLAAGAKYGNTLTIKDLYFDLNGKRSAGAANQYTVPLNLVADRSIQGQAAVGGSILPHVFNVLVTLDPDDKIKYCAGQFTNFWVATADPNNITYLSGNVGVGSTNPGTKLDIDGTAQAKAFMYASDGRLKENVREIPGALDRISKLHGVLFDWKNAEQGRDQLGLIAQEVEQVFPEAVIAHPETGMKSVAYGNLVAPLIEALKEQQELIAQQQKEIAEIKKALSKK